MEKVINWLNERGYTNIDIEYYSKISEWIEIWRGKANWLNLKTIDQKNYPLYSLNMAQKSCEDLSSIITSEPFDISAKTDNKKLQELLNNAKVLKKLPSNIEKMGYTGTIATVTRIKNADIEEKEDGTRILKRNPKTKIRTIDVKASQIIPLTVEDGEIINVAFVSENKMKINNEIKKVWYIELHELEEKGYQISNIYIRDDNGKKIEKEGIISTYNTLSDIPSFSILKMPKENIYEHNNDLGMALFGNAIDQLMVVDLAYNNFGMDFKLGGKLVIYDRKLTRVIPEEYIDENGKTQVRDKIIYPTDIQKQQFMEIGDDFTTNSNGEQKPFVYEYNPNLRVGDNKEGTQFGLDCYSFRIGYGTHYYSFENGKVNTTATEAILSNKDLVNNSRKVRCAVNDYLIGVCKALLLSERMLGDNEINIEQEISVADVDGFLEDDESKIKKAQQEYSQGLISLYTYLTKYKGMTDKEAKEEMKRIKDEDSISFLDETDEDKKSDLDKT